MTIACQSATTTVPITQPTTLTAQSISIAASNTPCYDPCTVFVTVTWINNTGISITTPQTIGITVDSGTPITTTTSGTIVNGGTVSYTFTVTGLLHSAPNIICPVPN